MGTNARSVGLSLKRRLDDLYSQIAGLKAAADTWVLDDDDTLLPSDATIKTAIEVYEGLSFVPLRLSEEIQEIKAGDSEPLPELPPVPINTDWTAIQNKPTTFPPSDHTHPAPSQLAEVIEIGALFLRPGQIEGALDWSTDGGQTWDCTFPPQQHMHTNFSDLDYPVVEEMIKQAGFQHTCEIALFPQSVVSEMASWGLRWAVCDGSAIVRDTPAGNFLVAGGCQFGLGDGSTTVNLPTLTAPAGYVYLMYVGSY